VPPQYGAHLVAWGADPGGRWWALVTWERHLARGWETPEQVWCSGWTDSVHVAQVDGEDYSRVPRIRLDSNPEWWPAPPGPRGVHFGILEPGAPLDAPEGLRWCSPRYSKRR
jgi:hypothetical protein